MRTLKAGEPSKHEGGAFTLITEQGLSLDVNGPPIHARRPRGRRHFGWSEEKEFRLMKATEIADKLRFQLDPRP